MNRHPCEYYIKYLISHPDAHDDRYVRHSVTSLGFPDVSNEILGRIRSEFVQTKPVNFRPTDRYHRESAKYLRTQGIWSLYHQDEAARQAATLLVDMKVRDATEKLLLGGMSHKDIARKVNARFASFYTTPAIQTYEHYFWNVSLLKVQDWASVFEQMDPRRDKTMAILQVGPALALHSAGFQQQIEAKAVLREMMSAVYFDFKEWAAQPRSMDRTDALTKNAKSAVALDNSLSQSDAQLKDTLKGFEMFRMRSAEQDSVKDIRKLAPHGNFSGSGTKLLDSGSPEDSIDEDFSDTEEEGAKKKNEES